MDGDGVESMVISQGQHGGAGGSPWDDGVFSSIKRVIITYGGCVNSIQTEYSDNGRSSWSDKHGVGGPFTYEVVLDEPNEYLISIHGYVGNWEKKSVIRSLTLESNTRIHGPFGKEEGVRFWFPNAGTTIVGFHGKSHGLLHSIGIKVVPILRNISKPQVSSHKCLLN